MPQLQQSLAAHHNELADLTTGWREKRRRTRELWRRRRRLLGRLGLFLGSGDKSKATTSAAGEAGKGKAGTSAQAATTGSAKGKGLPDIRSAEPRSLEEMTRTTAHLVSACNTG